MTALIEHLESNCDISDDIIDCIKAFKYTVEPCTHFKFGKYKSKSFAEVAGFDADYLQWVKKQQWAESLVPEIDKALARYEKTE